MNSTKRLTTVAVAAVAILSGTVLTAAPAHAARSDECNRLNVIALWNYRMFEWSRTFYGADSWEAHGYLRASQDAADFWAINC